MQGSGGLISYGITSDGNLGGTFAVDTQGEIITVLQNHSMVAISFDVLLFY